jgi:hypothetical protein
MKDRSKWMEEKKWSQPSQKFVITETKPNQLSKNQVTYNYRTLTAFVWVKGGLMHMFG